MLCRSPSCFLNVYIRLYIALDHTKFKLLTEPQVISNVCCIISAFSGPVADKSLHVG